ncbi:hypothetical protein [Dactylosporangium sp. NPDC049140]|uniref:hypothetical protein n=1 Tax=Dactylosporangium sp. NPDC049140 TaxID=3155647 RepID=UPI0034063858
MSSDSRVSRWCSRLLATSSTGTVSAWSLSVRWDSSAAVPVAAETMIPAAQRMPIFGAMPKFGEDGHEDPNHGFRSCTRDIGH